MADDLVTQLKTNAQSMAANIAPPAIGSDPLHYLNGQAAAEIERLTAALERIAGGDGYYPDYARAVLYGGHEQLAKPEK